MPVDQPVGILPRFLVYFVHDRAHVPGGEAQVGAFKNLFEFGFVEEAVEIVSRADENLGAKVTQLLIRQPREPRGGTLENLQLRGRRRHIRDVLCENRVRQRLHRLPIRVRLGIHVYANLAAHQRLVPRQRVFIHRRPFAAQRRELGEDPKSVFRIIHRKSFFQVFILDGGQEKSVDTRA